MLRSIFIEFKSILYFCMYNSYIFTYYVLCICITHNVQLFCWTTRRLRRARALHRRGYIADRVQSWSWTTRTPTTRSASARRAEWSNLSCAMWSPNQWWVTRRRLHSAAATLWVVSSSSRDLRLSADSRFWEVSNPSTSSFCVANGSRVMKMNSESHTRTSQLVLP